MLTKYQLFGIINLFISFFLIFLLSQFFTFPTQELDIQIILAFLPKVIVTFLLALNLKIAYKLIIKKNSENFKIDVIWTLFSIIWIPLIFVGYFFASDIKFFLISLLLICLAFYLIQKLSKRSAIYISGITISLVVFSILANFEEDYCWTKGDEEVAKTGQATVLATKEDAEQLNGTLGIEVTEGRQISTHFKAHFLCHKNFKFSEALKETYFYK